MLICDGHPQRRTALATVVGADASLALVAPPVPEPTTAIALTATHRPAVVLLDGEATRCFASAQVIRSLVTTSPTTSVVVMSAPPSRAALADVIGAGARGVVDPEDVVADVCAVVRRAVEGELLVELPLLPGLVEDLAADRRARLDAEVVLARLSRREREVLDLLADGASSAVISGLLYISPATTRTHVQNILSKLSVHSKLEAVALALRAGRPGQR